MDRVALITDIDTEPGSSLLKYCYSDYTHIIGTVSSSGSNFALTDMPDERLEVVEWKKRSPFEAKNILLSIIKKYKALDDAFIIHSCTADETPIHDLDIAYIDMTIDIWLKQYIFLCREILSYFLNGGNGFMLLVNNIAYKHENGNAALFESIHYGFDGFMRDLVTFCKKSNVRINGITAISPDSKSLSGYIEKLLSAKFRDMSGKIMTFGKNKRRFPF